MALGTPVLKATGNVGGNVTSVATSSWTPTAGRLYIVYVGSYDTTSSPVVPTLAGNGITWTQAVTDSQVDSPSNGLRQTAFWGIAPASPTTGATTASFSAGQANGAAISVEEWTGHDPATPIGDTDALSAASGTSLSATGLVYNRANSGVSVGVLHNGSAGGYTAGASMTLLGGSILGGNNSMQREYALTNVATPSMSWATSSEAIIIALEIQQPGGGSSAEDSGTDGATASDSAAAPTAALRNTVADGAKITDSATSELSSAPPPIDAAAPDTGTLQEDAHPDIGFSFPDEGAKVSDSATVTVIAEIAALFAAEDLFLSDFADAQVTVPSLPPAPGLQTRGEVITYTLTVIDRILADDQTNSHVLRQLIDYKGLLESVQ
jgi:hypothetical protein